MTCEVNQFFSLEANPVAAQKEMASLKEEPLDFLAAILQGLRCDCRVLAKLEEDELHSSIRTITNVNLHHLLLSNCISNIEIFDALSYEEPDGVFHKLTSTSLAQAFSPRVSFRRSIEINSQLFDSKYDRDFTKLTDSSQPLSRGGRSYNRPWGWKRYAFSVLGKFGDDDWIGANQPRKNECASVEGEWPVSYHGTSYHNGLSIAKEGYQLSKCVRQFFGRGIYTTPDIGVAALYAQDFEYKGEVFQIVLQNRVNPNSLNVIEKCVTGIGEYWISAVEEDLRPYGMCVRRMSYPNAKGAGQVCCNLQ